MTWAYGLAVTLSLLGRPQSQPMTLDDALKAAESNAFSLKTAASNVEKTKQQISQARAALGPQLSLNGTYTRFDKEIAAQFGGNSFVVRPIDNKTSALTLTLPIDISGNIRKGVYAAQAYHNAAIENDKAAKNDLYLTVKKAYIQVLQAQAQVKVLQESVDRAQEEMKNAQASFAAGTAAKVDVTRLEVQLSQAQSDLINGQNNVALAKNAFNNALARPIETPVELADLEIRTPQVVDPDALTQQAVQNRPDLRALGYQILGLGYTRSAQEAGLDPTLGLSAGQSRTFGAGGFGSSDATNSATLTLTIPIFDSGMTRAKVKAARQDEEQAKINLQQATLGVSLEVRQDLANLNSSQARLQVAQKQVQLATENFNIAKVKYAAGEAIPLEVTDAQTQLTQAETGLVNARYDYLNALSALERALGVRMIGEGK